MLFIAASRDMFGDGAAVSRAISRLKFILRCTRTSGIKTALADSAATLLKRIESPLGLASSTDAATTPALSFDVPVLNMDVYMPVLKACIDIVVSLEEKKTSVSTNMRDASLRKAEVTAMLTAMSTLCMTDGASPNSQVAVDAVTAVWNTHKAMEVRVSPGTCCTNMLRADRRSKTLSKAHRPNLPRALTSTRKKRCLTPPLLVHERD